MSKNKICKLIMSLSLTFVLLISMCSFAFAYDGIGTSSDFYIVNNNGKFLLRNNDFTYFYLVYSCTVTNSNSNLSIEKYSDSSFSNRTSQNFYSSHSKSLDAGYYLIYSSDYNAKITITDMIVPTPTPTPTPTPEPTSMIEGAFDDVGQTSTGIFTVFGSVITGLTGNAILALFTLVVPLVIFLVWLIKWLLRKKR